MKRYILATAIASLVAAPAMALAAGRWQQYSQRTYSRSANRQTGARRGGGTGAEKG